MHTPFRAAHATLRTECASPSYTPGMQPAPYIVRHEYVAAAQSRDFSPATPLVPSVAIQCTTSSLVICVL